MQFQIVDAIHLRNSYSDQSHRFWGYFQVVAAGSIGVVWAAPFVNNAFVALLATGFFMFGIGNGRLVVDAQRAAIAVANAIDEFIKRHPEDITPEFLGVINVLKLEKPVVVWALHVILMLSVTSVIAARALLK